MKITNISRGVLTFGHGEHAESVRPGETSSDMRLKADDPTLVAALNAKLITVSGRGVPKGEEAAGGAPAS
ncbi:hypothetical protein [Methylobacterium sp. CM6257]